MRPRKALLALALTASTLVAAPAARAQDPAPPAPPEQQPAPPEQQPPPFDIDAPSLKHGATVARITTTTRARRRPSMAASGRRVATHTAWSYQPQVLLVLDGATHDGRDWVKLLLPDRPNGSAGWVPRDHVVLSRTQYWVDIRTSPRTVRIYRAGKRVRSFRAVVGTPATPTPHGLAAIYERNRQPDPGAFLGPWALSLTALSEVLENYGGGPGRVAIHGRAGASLLDPLGSARSHGCIRVNNVDIAWMARRVPAGTPVNITAR